MSRIKIRNEIITKADKHLAPDFIMMVYITPPPSDGSRLTIKLLTFLKYNESSGNLKYSIKIMSITVEGIIRFDPYSLHRIDNFLQLHILLRTLSRQVDELLNCTMTVDATYESWLVNDVHSTLDEHKNVRTRGANCLV